VFSDFFFLIIVLILISFSPVGNGNDWIASPSEAFWIGMGVYILLLALIYGQNKLFKKVLHRRKDRILCLVNLYLITFLAYDHFVLASPRFFPPSLVLVAIFSFLLYFLGLFVFHLSAYPYLSMTTRDDAPSPLPYALTQLRLILPFIFPFL